jgi:arsenite methyltransferase
MQKHFDLKERVQERYCKIALNGNSECCCMPSECCSGGTITSPMESSKLIGYDPKELESIPQSSILVVGCGAPVKWADIQEGETVVDLGSGVGIYF